MSRLRISVPPKAMVAGLVFALLAVVIVINLRVLIGRSEKALPISVDLATPELAPPGDLIEVTQDVAAYQRGDHQTAVFAVASMTRGRDPFVFAPTKSQPKSGKPPKPKPRKRNSGTPLRCTAIFVSNGVHSALVAGRVVNEGDRVKSYSVGEITEKGVTLYAGGRKKFLALETKRDGGTVGAPVSLGR